MADTSAVLFGIITSILAARWLGPAHKGLYSSLLFLFSLNAHAFSMGLGDAAIVRVGQKKASKQEALSATVAANLLSSLGGMAVLWLSSLTIFRKDWAEVDLPALIMVLGLPFFMWTIAASFLLNSQERVVEGSVVLASMAGATAAFFLVFVGGMPLGLQGASLASLSGAALALGAGIGLLKHSGLRLRPHWDWEYLKPALKYGLSIQASHLITLGLLRADLLFVYLLQGSRSAGLYSVALNSSVLVSLLPIAISTATFPRLARVDEDDARELLITTFRLSMVAVILATIGFMVLAPWVIPWALGEAFRASIPPALIVSAGSFAWSGQWILCRGQAARGRPGLQFTSFGLSLVTMCLLDAILIPTFGLLGAALTSVIAPTAGLLYCLNWHRRSSAWPHPLTSLLPRLSDIKEFAIRSLELLPWPKVSRASKSP